MNTTPTTEINIGSTMLELAKGDTIKLTTVSGEVVEGIFVSSTARGIRIHVTPELETSRYVTRKMSVVADVELVSSIDDEAAAPAGEATASADPAQPETDPAATSRAQAYVKKHHLTGEAAENLVNGVRELSAAAVDSEFAALVANSTEFGHGNTEIERLVEQTAAEQAAAAPAAESTEDAPAADHDTDPMVNGKLLSQMRFAEVMELAKKYKTPGRGVARIDALRAGVALAISQEAGRIAEAS